MSTGRKKERIRALLQPAVLAAVSVLIPVLLIVYVSLTDFLEKNRPKNNRKSLPRTART